LTAAEAGRTVPAVRDFWVTGKSFVVILPRSSRDLFDADPERYAAAL
jgi:hypothetical protein